MTAVTTCRRAAATLAAAALVGCASGGGGGGGGGSSPPSPPPPPPPPAQNFDTAEYRFNTSLGEINAIAAYNQGLTGDGVTVAVIDHGLDQSHIDLNANIAPGGVDLIATRPGGASLFNPDSSHGTSVAGIIAAEKNNFGPHGVAFEAHILGIRIEDPTTCGGPLGCDEQDSDRAAAIDYAVAHGATVINISLGNAPGDTTIDPVLVQAMRNAVANDVLIVLAAGNNSAGDPNAFALQALDAQVLGGALIVGAVDSNGAMFGFSDRAGVARDVYLVAPSRVRVLQINDAISSGFGNGTSFAAPHVAGAAALLRELFPNLTAIEVADILLESARDLGAAGVDNVFGWGLLDIAAAIQPIGPVSAGVRAGGGVRMVEIAGGVLAAGAFGDAFSGLGDADRVTFFDRYDRGFRLRLSDRVTTAAPAPMSIERFIRQDVGEIGYSATLAGGGRFYFGHRDPGVTIPEAARAPFEEELAGERETPRARFDTRLGDGVEMSAAVGFSSDALIHSGPAERRARALFVADDLLGGTYGFVADRDVASAAVSRRLPGGGRVSLAASGGDYDIAVPFDDVRAVDASYASFTASYATRLKGADVGLEAALLVERDSVLGAASTGAFRLGDGARTALFSLEAGRALSPDMEIFGRASLGVTALDEAAGSLVRADDALTSSAFNLSLVRYGVFRDGDAVGLGVSQPLRVEAGTLGFEFATLADPADGDFGFQTLRVPASPDGRELDLELSYRTSVIGRLTLEGNLIHRRDPGHLAAADDEFAAILRLRTGGVRN